MWSCIVVGTDGSETAQEAVRQAAGLVVVGNRVAQAASCSVLVVRTC